MSSPTDEQILKAPQNINNLLAQGTSFCGTLNDGTTPEPTLENIEIVKTNLKNMQTFNDYIYNNGQAYFANCFLLLTSKDDSDPGLSVGLNLLEGSFAALGDVYGLSDFTKLQSIELFLWCAQMAESDVNTVVAIPEAIAICTMRLGSKFR